MSFTEAGPLIDEITKETIASVSIVMDRAGTMIPARVKSTFDTRGKRGGNPEWPKVAFRWLMRRRMWPGGAMTLRDYWDKQHGKLTPAQSAYYRSAIPLIDTGKLRNSIIVMERTMEGLSRAFMLIGSPLPYAEQHDQGIPDKIRQRPYMHLVSDDLAELNTIVTEVFADNG